MPQSRPRPRGRTVPRGSRKPWWIVGALLCCAAGLLRGFWPEQAQAAASAAPLRGGGTLAAGPGFTGEYQFPNDQTYLRARSYDPALGRFSQRDPLDTALLSIAYPAGANRYAYANNAPTVNTDPSGHFVPAVVVGGIVTGIIVSDMLDPAPANAPGLGEDCLIDIPINWPNVGLGIMPDLLDGLPDRTIGRNLGRNLGRNFDNLPTPRVELPRPGRPLDTLPTNEFIHGPRLDGPPTLTIDNLNGGPVIVGPRGQEINLQGNTGSPIVYQVDGPAAIRINGPVDGLVQSNQGVVNIHSTNPNIRPVIIETSGSGSHITVPTDYPIRGAVQENNGVINMNFE